MSLVQSLIQPYTAAFVAAMDAATGPNVTLVDGPPPASLLQTAQVVWVGDVTGAQATIALGSPTDSGPKQEEFMMQVHISIYGPTTPAALNTHALQGEQAFTILEAINAKLRSDERLGLTPEANPSAYVTFAETRGPVQVKKGGSDTARETSVSFSVYVQGFLEGA
jgi:hypothetical protein